MIKNQSSQPKILFRQKIILLLFGLSLFFVLLEVGLRLGGFILLSMQEYRNSQSIKQKGVYRIMCLGESTTQNQYPQFLEQALNQRNIGVRFSVVDKGITGMNTSAILSQVEFYLNEYYPDMVVTMMGINDGGEYIPFEAATASKGMLFIRSFRIYKLSRLIWLHIRTKIKEIGIYNAESILTEETFKKAIELNPGNDNAYVRLGGFYQEQGKYPQAEEALKKAIELNPKNDDAYVRLSWSCRGQGKYSQIENVFKKAIELNPGNDNAYVELGRFYKGQGKYPQAEEAFKKAIELNPKNDDAYVRLGGFYQEQGKYPQAEDLFKKVLEFDPKNDCAYGALLSVCKERGKLGLAKEYAEKVNSLRLRYCKLVTVNNYCKLKQILDKRKIKLVCVQYPMRNIQPLKKIFKEDENIIFVDNERIFKDVVRDQGYNVYFRDMFGGDFGHCTPKGNRLLADNIANVIIKKYFNK